jgi:hypothetical protein
MTTFKNLNKCVSLMGASPPLLKGSPRGPQNRVSQGGRGEWSSPPFLPSERWVRRIQNCSPSGQEIGSRAPLSLAGWRMESKAPLLL